MIQTMLEAEPGHRGRIQKLGKLDKPGGESRKVNKTLNKIPSRAARIYTLTNAAVVVASPTTIKKEVP